MSYVIDVGLNIHEYFKNGLFDQNYIDFFLSNHIEKQKNIFVICTNFHSNPSGNQSNFQS